MYFKRIKDLRIDHDLFQEQVAEIIGLNREVYRRYEAGIRAIPIDCLIKLADLYDVSVDYLIGRSNTKEAIGRTQQSINNSIEYRKEHFSPVSVLVADKK